ncbi:MAG: phosphatase PAP2 family protein [Candidatus Magasanikbacteria bacterium]
MNQSLNHKIFFAINNIVGKNKFFDLFILFCAKYLVFLMFIFGIFYVYTLPESFQAYLLSYATIMFTVGICISWTVAYLWKNPRPVVEYPNIKRLLKTLGTWKSFPSDHTFMATLMALLLWEFGAPTYFVWFLILGVIGVGFGRIYVGAHYPRDVAGGIVLGFLMFFLVIYSFDVSHLLL